MTLFVILSLLLAAATLAILAWRGPAVAHVTDPATAAAAVMRPTRGLVLALAGLIAVVAVGGYAWVGSPRLLPVTPDAGPGPGPAADAQAEFRLGREWLLGPHVADEFDPLQQSLAADVADDAVLVGQAPKAGPQLLTARASVGTQVLFDDLT